MPITRHTCSKIDRRAYWNYVRTCLAAQCSPMSALHWMLLTQSSVDFAVKKWAAKENGALRAKTHFDSDDERNQPWAKKARTHRPDSEMLAHIGELNKQGARPGWVIGEFRAGIVYPERVRSQTGTNGGRVFRGNLIRRLCKCCQTLLNAGRFSQNGKPSGRTICKACDNNKRIERRKRARQLAQTNSPLGEIGGQLRAVAAAP